MEIKDKLQYNEPLDVYIQSSAEVNAYSRETDIDDMPNVITINSALYNLLNKEELKFVIGHEMGHLINHDIAINQLVSFVFGDEADYPACLKNKISLFQQLAELSADRYGYMASENLNACLTALFKLTCGIDLQNTNMNIEALFAENKARLEYFMNDAYASNDVHPVNPARVEALSLFAKAKTQKALNQGMDEIINLLLNGTSTDLNKYMDDYFAAAGIIAGTLEGKLGKRERDLILYNMGHFYFSPSARLKEIEKDNTWQICSDAVNRILEIDPEKAKMLLSFVIHIVLYDEILTEKETRFLYDFAKKIGFDKIDVSEAIRDYIQDQQIVLTSALQ